MFGNFVQFSSKSKVNSIRKNKVDLEETDEEKSKNNITESQNFQN